MALEWFNREDGHAGSWLYIEQEQQQGDGDSLALEQDTDDHQRFPCKDEREERQRQPRAKHKERISKTCGPNGKPHRGNKQTKREKKCILRGIYCEFNSFMEAVTSVSRFSCLQHMMTLAAQARGSTATELWEKHAEGGTNLEPRVFRQSS